MRNHRRVDRIGLGALPESLGKSPYLGRIDDHHRQARACQRRSRNGFEAAFIVLPFLPLWLWPRAGGGRE